MRTGTLNKGHIFIFCDLYKRPTPLPRPGLRAAESLRTTRLFYGCSYMFHLSGDNSRDRY